MKKKKKINKSEWADYDYHLPVLRDEAVNYLVGEGTSVCGHQKSNKGIQSHFQVYIDGTLGGGGHAAIILQRLGFGGKLFAFDKDISAIERAKNIFEEEFQSPSPSLVLFNEPFSKACSICEDRGISPMGILLDLGVSSKQLDTDQRGISYRINCPLDMRFDAGTNSDNSANNITAKDILNTYSEEELTAIFRNYGEEPKSRAIARRIVDVRRVRSLETTFDLRTIIEDCTPKLHHFKTLSRIFQALRIEVNQELAELSKTLRDITNIMKPEGRIVVISYHSLEDRIVKQFFKENSCLPKVNKYALLNNDNTKLTTIIVPKLKLLTEKPIIPSEEEIKRNPRARSAKMRVAERR